MRLVIAAVGKLKQGPERDLAERYAKRATETGRALGWRPIEVVELRESRAQETDKRKLEESIALANVIPDGSTVVLLEERGESLDSASLAAKLRGWADAGQPAITFIIGGPDGLAASLRDRAGLRLAFGSATWPHQMVRIMLMEQLYRAATILSGHPYHRV
jgi:23S rRNA (pseudouridine1915-N3)-methyltransferase